MLLLLRSFLGVPQHGFVVVVVVFVVVVVVVPRRYFTTVYHMCHIFVPGSDFMENRLQCLY
jgi:hypothetical protein